MEGISNNVNRVMKVVDLFAGCGGFSLDAISSKVSVLHFCTKEFRRCSTEIKKGKEVIVNSIVDNNGYDYVELTSEIEKAINILDAGMKVGGLYVENEDYESIKDKYSVLTPEQVIAYDDTTFSDSTFNNNEEVNNCHLTLLRHSDFLHGRVRDELFGIRDMLIELRDYDSKLETCLEEKYDYVCKIYENGRWKKDKEKLKFIIREEIQGLNGNEEKQEAIEHLIKKNSVNYSETEKGFLNAKNPAVYLYCHRKELSEDDMYSLLQVKYVEDILESIKIYFRLAGEAGYKYLFCNLASEKFVTIMLPSLLCYDDFETKYKRLGILLACNDLGLTKWHSNQCISSFNEVVNNALADEEEKVPNPKTYTTYYSKLSEKRFYRLLNKKDLTKEEKSIVDNLKDGYHLALSTLCKALNREYPPFEVPLEFKKMHKYAIEPRALVGKNRNPINLSLLNRYAKVVSGEVKEYIYNNLTTK